MSSSRTRRRARRLLRAVGLDPVMCQVVGFATAVPSIMVAVFFDSVLGSIMVLALAATILFGSFAARSHGLSVLESVARYAASEPAGPGRPNTELILAVLDELANFSYPLPKWAQTHALPDFGASRVQWAPASGPVYQATVSWLLASQQRAWVAVLPRVPHDDLTAAELGVVRRLAAAPAAVDALWAAVGRNLLLAAHPAYRRETIAGLAVWVANVAERCDGDTLAALRALVAASDVGVTVEELRDLELVAQAVVS